MNLSRTPTARCHLGPRTSLLLDGELDADARGIVLLHLADCPQCSAALQEERAVRDLLRSATAPALSPQLFARLLAIGGDELDPNDAATADRRVSLLSASITAGGRRTVGVATGLPTVGVPADALRTAGPRLLTRPGSEAATRPGTAAPATRPSGASAAGPRRGRRLRGAGRRLRHAAPVTALAVALGAVVAAGGSALNAGNPAVSPSATLVSVGGSTGSASAAGFGGPSGVSRAGSGLQAQTVGNQTQRRSAVAVPAQVVTMFVSVSDVYTPTPVVHRRPVLEWHEPVLARTDAQQVDATGETGQSEPASR